MDITRVELDLRKHYAAGRLQQGRPILDADTNHASILFEGERRVTNVDVIGPYGSPDDGFRVGGQTSSGGSVDFTLAPGTLYLGGLRETLEPAASGQGMLFSQQTDWLQQAAQDRPPVGVNGRRDLVVLEAWEQEVSAVEDGEMIDPALGVDTFAWLRRMRRVHVMADVGTDDCAAAMNRFLDSVGPLGPDNGVQTGTTLSAVFNDSKGLGDLCNPPIAGGYLGAENQAIRVELLDGGRLLWAYDDAAPLYRVSIDGTGRVLTLDTPPRDQVHWPVVNQTVEVIAWSALLPNGEKLAEMRGPVSGAVGAAPVSYLTTVTIGFGPGGQTITVADPPPAGFNAAWKGRFGAALDDTQAGRKAFMRVWWRGDDVSALPISYSPGNPVALGNTGVSVTIHGFRPRSGEYWTIAVRPKTPDQLYPWQLVSGRPPDGPRLFYAPLGILTCDGVTPPHDCRPTFAPLINAGACCEVTLKPDQDWQGRIRAAVQGGDVSLCFEPGAYRASSTIAFSTHSVKITGAGAGSTRIIGAALECVFSFTNCPSVVLADIGVAAGRADSSLAGLKNLAGAVTCRNCTDVQIERVTLVCADADLRAASCLAIYHPLPAANAAPQPFNARVRHSRFEVGHFQVGVLLVNADRAVVEDNLVVTAPEKRAIAIGDLPNRKFVVARLGKALVWNMKISSTAAPTTRKARQRARRRQAMLLRLKAPGAQAAAPLSAQAEAAPPASEQATPAAAGGQSAVRGAQAAASAQALRVRPLALLSADPTLDLNLQQAGRAHVKEVFGTLHLSFLSSDRLGNAWTHALQAAKIDQNTSAARVRLAVKQIADNALLQPHTVAPAFGNWVASVLPLLYSTSSQGIVVGGDLANDVRIQGNTIDGTVQGIHVGLSDLKVRPHAAHLIAGRVQITGNTIHLRLTPETWGDRHGIFLGCVNSAVVQDNHMDVTSTAAQAGGAPAQPIQAVKVAGHFGPLVLVERNSMTGFTNGIYTDQDARSIPAGTLWKVAENVSSSPHLIHQPYFRVADNVPP
jgi:hypothetical protein